MSIDLIHMSLVFLFKQKTAYEVRISDCSSYVCSSDMPCCPALAMMMRLPSPPALHPASMLWSIKSNPSRWTPKQAKSPKKEIGRASGRDKGYHYGQISEVAESL